ncbi:MAG: squalene/phytoene synthase family protein [Planctomycetes bacterium]|nr:squalene/phytoene synthase family protein [Planctomycetota bacterium]
MAASSPNPSTISPATLARTHYENFSVLSLLVPRHLRSPFAHVYWFCRTADDLADEHDGSPAARDNALTSLRQFRTSFNQALADPECQDTRFRDLSHVIRAHHLDPALFHALLDAFEQDQIVTRYTSMPQVLDYCSRSANPVGRIVLQLAGLDFSSTDSAPLLARSDAICTALQLVNHCQDIRRDLLDRDRLYMPSSDVDIAARLRHIISARRTPLHDREVSTLVTPVITAARDLFTQGQDLPDLLRSHTSPDFHAIAPTIHLFLQGGLAIQSLVERDPPSLMYQRPRISRLTRLRLVLNSALWKYRH